MQKRRLGKTNLLVSEIGFGGIPIQKINQETVNRLVEELQEKDINFIDSARGYTVSEELLGTALIGKRENFIIATKSMKRTYEEMKRDILLSLENFKTETIDLYQCHLVKTKAEYEQILSSNGAYKALLEAKEAGKIKHIGITCHSLDFLSSIIEEMPFETIQFPYNILEIQGEELFNRAYNRDIGIIIMKPLAGGFLNENPELALRFILNNEYISTAIPGMHSLAEIRKNALESKKIVLSKQERETIKALQEKYGNDFCRRCGYCLPCTAEIDIPAMFLMEGYYTRYSLKNWAIERYNAFNKKASDCMFCNNCLSKCPYELNIPEKLQKVKNVFGK